MPLLVKICGLSTRETLDVALESGADMVGFVFFPPSPRHISLETARELGKQAKGRAVKVALTVDADDATIENIIETLRPDILQLHGKETTARLRDLKQKFGLPLMKALPVETAADLATAMQVRVYTIGVGREGLVPMPVRARDPVTGQVVEEFQMRESDLDEALLEQIADRTGGAAGHPAGRRECQRAGLRGAG